jgi:hypothetical protein
MERVIAAGRQVERNVGSRSPALLHEQGLAVECPVG